jgi:hypothetical protein
MLWGGTKSLGTAATSGLLYKPQMIDEVDCGAIGGIKIDEYKYIFFKSRQMTSCQLI